MSNNINDSLPFPLTHGYLLKDYKDLPLPTCTLDLRNELSRPDMKNASGVTKSEFQDSLEVQIVKADLFIDMCARSKALGILMGAGASVSSGIYDYASKNDGTKQRLTKEFTNSLRPTPAHRVLAAMHRAGKMHLLDILQQNHDGLQHLAGIGHDKINEIHGAWKDTTGKNPVVPMNGNLRTDLYERMLEQEAKQDMGFAIGTSLSGLNADRIIATASKKGMNPAKYGKDQLGAVILSIQQTSYDSGAALRIFAKTDDFMLLVAYRLGLTIDFDTDYSYNTGEPMKKATSLRPPSTIAAIELLKKYDLYFKTKDMQGVTLRNAAGAAAASSTNNNNNNNTVAAATTVDRSIISTTNNAAASTNSSPTTIAVGNRHFLETSSSAADKNSHNWTMFVRANKSGVVRSVTFHLHPTFNPAAVKVSQPTSNNKHPGCEEFCLSRLGWGTFTVGVEVELAATGEKLRTEHTLQFDQDEESKIAFQK